MSCKEKRIVFVTVGTTKFEALVRVIDDPEFADLLVSQGYTDLVIQKGAGEYIPQRLCPGGASSVKLDNGLTVSYFDFTPSLANHIREAALVVSHAGSGSIFETLHARKPLVVVPNPILMDNHQEELGRKLEQLNCLFCAAPNQLFTTIRNMDISKLQDFVTSSPGPIVQSIDRLMGYQHVQ